MLGVSTQHVIHGIDEFLHGFAGFIAHVRNAEAQAFNFSVTTIDDKSVLGFERFDEG